ENETLACSWTISDGRIKHELISNKLSGKTLELKTSECFEIALGDSPLAGLQPVKASRLTVVGDPELGAIQPLENSPRAAERFGGQRIVVDLASPDGHLKVRWQAVLRDGSNYLRQHIELTTAGEPVEVDDVALWDVAVPGAQVAGSVDGSPVVSGELFFACEHPMAWSRVADSHATDGKKTRLECGYSFGAMLRPGASLARSWVVGVVPEGQLRRGFLYYLERERAHPYRPFLHYNNGSEIGCEYWQRKLHGEAEEAERFRKNQQQVWLENIDAFGKELVAGRGVKMDSFVHDFEWDDETTPWRFHQGYPEGFAPVQQAARRHGASVGVWFSPFGGYPGRKVRIESARGQGMETNDKGLSLAGPRYYARVRAACTGMVRKFGVNYFKFDGFGAGNNQPGAGSYSSDVEALLRLIDELRQLDPQVFVNPSTGSWPSPFWLFWADSIWRQGSDTNLAGKGSERQRWITYRDSGVYRGVLARGPLYPISSLMIHGIYINHLPLFGNPYDPASKPPTYEPADIVAEVRSFFGTGTNLQELYIAPDLMTPDTWDAVAEAAIWARENADVFVDTHWVGGDPADGHVYGWASWSNEKAILVLRNPEDQPAQITLDLAKVFELPKGAAEQYVLTSPWKEDAGKPGITASAGRPHTFDLEPFGVLSFDAVPAVTPSSGE
ncbi:MAG: enterotoxin, partial [Planctomycetota bacterium]